MMFDSEEQKAGETQNNWTEFFYSVIHFHSSLVKLRTPDKGLNLEITHLIRSLIWDTHTHTTKVKTGIWRRHDFFGWTLQLQKTTSSFRMIKSYLFLSKIMLLSSTVCIRLLHLFQGDWSWYFSISVMSSCRYGVSDQKGHGHKRWISHAWLMM